MTKSKAANAIKRTKAAAQLTASINFVLADWIKHRGISTPAEINSGSCAEFSHEVMLNLGGIDAAYDLGVDELEISNFLVPSDDSESGPEFDRKLLSRRWPKFQPPAGLDWDDLDRLSEDAGFSCGTHVWLLLGKKHYDAEAPEGVENPFDLPFFQRIVESWVNETKTTSKPK